MRVIATFYVCRCAVSAQSAEPEPDGKAAVLMTDEEPEKPRAPRTNTTDRSAKGADICI